MSQATTTTPAQTTAEAPPAAFPITEPLPAIRTPLSPSQVLEKLSVASRRGRLAGFDRDTTTHSFTALLFSEPFDHTLTAKVDPDPAGGSIIRSTAVMLRRMPVIFAIVLVLTVWPGVWFTDQMIPGQWGWIPTWWWYLPITVIPLPWVWIKLMKKSKTGAGISAHEVLTKVAAEVEGTIDPAKS